MLEAVGSLSWLLLRYLHLGCLCKHDCNICPAGVPIMPLLKVAKHSCCCYAESATSPLSAPAADDKTRLVRSQLLQDGASDVQPPSVPAPSAAMPSSSIVQGEGAPEPKSAVPAPVSEPASVQSTESRPAQPPSAQPSASSSAPAPQKESGEDLLCLSVACCWIACCCATLGLSIAGLQSQLWCLHWWHAVRGYDAIAGAPGASSKSIRQEETEKEAKKLLDEEEERRKTRRRKKVPLLGLCQLYV